MDTKRECCGQRVYSFFVSGLKLSPTLLLSIAPTPPKTMEVPASNVKKRKIDWSGGNPAVKSDLLNWMSYIFLRQDPRFDMFPELPALGRLIASAKKDLWSEECYQEILLLGKVSGLKFKDYTRKLLPRHIGREGCSLANIPMESDDGAEVGSNSFGGAVVVSSVTASLVVEASLEPNTSFKSFDLDNVNDEAESRETKSSEFQAVCALIALQSKDDAQPWSIG